MKNCSAPARAKTLPALTWALTLGAALGVPDTTLAGGVDVGVSVQVSQPGVYGRIDIGTFPQPQVVVAQPVLVVAPPPHVGARPAPIYMWVPPGHQKHWSKHCANYGACGVPVYFVRDDWYQSHVAPKAKGHGKGNGNGNSGKGKGHDK